MTALEPGGRGLEMLDDPLAFSVGLGERPLDPLGERAELGSLVVIDVAVSLGTLDRLIEISEQSANVIVHARTLVSIDGRSATEARTRLDHVCFPVAR